MLRMVNRLMALSLGVHREQLEHRMGLTWPRPVGVPVSPCRRPPRGRGYSVLTLLVAAVVLSLLDHLGGVLSVLVLKKLLCEGMAMRSQKFRCCWKTQGAGPTSNFHPTFNQLAQCGRGQDFERALGPGTESADPHQCGVGPSQKFNSSSGRNSNSSFRSATSQHRRIAEEDTCV
jgi:hypothetical protein